MYAKSSLVVGCGKSNQRELCKYDSIVALDMDKTKLKAAKTQSPDAQYIAADARHLPLKKKSNVAHVVCTEVLEHVSNYEKVLDEITNVEPQSILITFPTELKEKILERSAGRTYREQLRSPNYVGHVSRVKLEQVSKIISEQGYEIKVDLSSANILVKYMFLTNLFDLVLCKYEVDDFGSFLYTHPKTIYEKIEQVSNKLCRLGEMPYILWKLLRIRTVHDSYMLFCEKKM